MALTEKQARAEGYRVVRGAYLGTTDDRADRWYAEAIGSSIAVDRRGKGFATKAEALKAIEDKLDSDAYWADVNRAWWAARATEAERRNS